MKQASVTQRELTVALLGQFPWKIENFIFNINFRLEEAIKEHKESITTTEFGDYLFLVMMKEFYMGMDRIRNEARKNLIL